MGVDRFASRIIDVCAETPIVEDYDLSQRDDVVVRCRIKLVEGFLQVYRNFDTGRVAYAWIVDEERVFGADNTGEWHRHPFNNPETHESCGPVSLGEVLREIADE